ncbi:MAG TPA: carboxypeptidase regulatory-like domain-containing protein, partial [Acidobacteriota bacterium]
MIRRCVSVLVVVILLSTVAHAQRLTGTIRGQVTDEEGGPLPGVSVNAAGPALIGGPELFTTTEDGAYRFPGLPPGVYSLTFALEGFQTVVHEQLRVILGTTIQQDVTMRLSQVAEQMVITGETPLVDPTKPGFSTNYTQEYIENTPIARFTFFDFVQMAPGSSPMRFDNTAFSHSVLGSNTNENMYQMDGTDLTAPLTGAAWPWPNTDIIEEIEILDIGAPAEYGNYQGAVVNVVTKSGGNEFHGDAKFFFQSQDLTGSNAEIDGIPFNRDRYTDFTFQMGGPILKDKLWFFGGVQTRREHFSQPGTPPESPVEEDDDRYFIKGTWDINQKNKLQFSLHNDYYNIPEPVTVSKPIEAAIVETGSNPTPSALWTSTLNDKAILEVRYAGFYGHDIGEPQNGIYASGRYDFGTGVYSDGILSWYDGDIWKSQFSGKLSYFADNFLKGDHDFRFGAQYTTSGTNYIYAYTNGVKFYDYTYT